MGSVLPSGPHVEGTEGTLPTTQFSVPNETRWALSHQSAQEGADGAGRLAEGAVFLEE